MSGVFYVVSTPIGNLEDITLRALRILKEVDVIACEDTRVTRKLLDAHDVRTKVVAFHAHSGTHVRTKLIDRVQDGESVALVSDAGTPLVSDPGVELVAEAVQAGLRVVPIPGASAMLSALVGAGLPTHRVLYLGFLPRKASDQAEVIGHLAGSDYTLVIYESARRLATTLEALQRSLGDRSAAVARELTKKFETFERGRLSELAIRFAEPPKGEVVIVVGGAPRGSAETKQGDLQTEVRKLLAAGVRPSEAAKTVAGAHGISKKEAYKVVLEISGEE
jgi:16S rRNA (cytidine1402-2'-O)-methyltransferase